jgi:hypothetical protein
LSAEDQRTLGTAFDPEAFFVDGAVMAPTQQGKLESVVGPPAAQCRM